MQPLSGKQRPDLLTSLMNMSFVPRLPREMHLCQILFKCSTPAIVFGMLQNLTLCLLLAKCRIPCACHAKATSEPSKMIRACGVLNILTWTCASRHNGEHFFDISTSKSTPNLVCFVHFDLDMCFATAASTFSTSQLPKVVRARCVLYILTCKSASRHNGVHCFDISTSKSAPKLRCFLHFDFEMWFAPQRRVICHLSSGQMAPHRPL